MLFNLDFANNTILLCFFFIFLIIDLYHLVPAVIAQIFSHIAELVISIRILFSILNIYTVTYNQWLLGIYTYILIYMGEKK